MWHAIKLQPPEKITTTILYWYVCNAKNKYSQQTNRSIKEREREKKLKI